ncbi:MAG: hypothetical protein J1E82_03400, partial [Muribaculaceae bacterium]|nr:hypothetical protein [Muribaculaceae bacterium]
KIMIIIAKIKNIIDYIKAPCQNVQAASSFSEFGFSHLLWKTSFRLLLNLNVYKFEKIIE